MTMHDDLHTLADEYVLGLLDDAQAQLVTRRLDHDAALRAAVAKSRERFIELDMTAVPVAPSPDLWPKIESGLHAQVARAETEAEIANDNRQPLWRRTAFAAMAASVLLAAGLGYSVLSPVAPQVIAVLLDESGEPLVLVEDFGNASAKITPLVDFDVPSDRQMQVWTLPSVDRGPVSLGLMERSASTTLHGPDLPQPTDNQLYEITLEQLGGSPTGRPTGPILVKGFAKEPR